MTEFPLALLVGLAAGFVGAIPPGPLNVTIIRKTSAGAERDAFRVALGGALIDFLVCLLVGLGFSWILEKVLTSRWPRLVLALFLVAYGLKILIVDRRRDGDRPGVPVPQRKEGARFPFLTGLLQGAANPALVVNWTLFIGFLVSHRLLHAGLGAGAGFALGVGVGVFLWFLVLIELVERLKSHPAGEWIRKSTVLAGLLLVAFGLVFTWKSIGELG